MQRNKISYLSFDGRRQVVVGGVLVREQRVAAFFRYLDRIEQRRARRDCQVRIIGMEVGAGVGQPDRLLVLLAVGEDEDVGVRGMVELVDDVRLRPAEPLRKAQEFGGGEALGAQYQDLRGKE